MSQSEHSSIKGPIEFCKVKIVKFHFLKRPVSLRSHQCNIDQIFQNLSILVQTLTSSPTKIYLKKILIVFLSNTGIAILRTLYNIQFGESLQVFSPLRISEKHIYRIPDYRVVTIKRDWISFFQYSFLDLGNILCCRKRSIKMDMLTLFRFIRHSFVGPL